MADQNIEICTIKALINNKEYTLKVDAREALDIMKMIREVFYDDNTRVYVTAVDPFSKDKTMSIDDIISIIKEPESKEENKTK